MISITRVPVYFFTYHAYRSWMPDHKRGFVKEGEGYLPPNPKLAKAYRDVAKFPPVEFDHDTEKLLIEVAQDVCGRRDWHFHGGATEPSHFHALVSWRGNHRWQDVRGKIRNILSLELSKRAGTTGRPWFVQKASRKRVRDRDHFDYLMKTYILKKHRGWRWTEIVRWVPPKRRNATRGRHASQDPRSRAASNSPARKGGVAGATPSEEVRPKAPLVINWDLDDETIKGLSVE